MFTMQGSANRWGLAIFQIALLLCFLIFSSQAQASLKDGIYTGVYKVVWSHPNNDSKVGDRGEFNFVIKENRVVDLNDLEDSPINAAKIRSDIQIKDGRMKGAAFLDFLEDSGEAITAKFAVDGVVADGAFIGKAEISIIAVNNQVMGDIIIEKMLFESD